MQVSCWSAQLRDYDSHNHENRHRFWDEEISGNPLVNTLAPMIGLWASLTAKFQRGGNSVNCDLMTHRVWLEKTSPHIFHVRRHHLSDFDDKLTRGCRLKWQNLEEYPISSNPLSIQTKTNTEYEGIFIEKFPQPLALSFHQIYSSKWGHLKALCILFKWVYGSMISNKRWLSDRPKCWRKHVNAGTTQKAKKIPKV